MAKFFDWISGKPTLTIPNVTSAGAGDAGKMVQLDAAGKLDQSLMPSGLTPEQFTANANGAITARDMIYLEAAGTWARASAASGGNAATYWATNSAISGAPVTGQREGDISGMTGLVVGTTYYLSDSVPGGVMAAPGPVSALTGKIGQTLGIALTTTVLTFEPDAPFVLN